MTFRERFDDWLNPIAVKELRQAVRGKFVMVAVILSLLGELIAVAAITVSRSLEGGSTPIGPIAFSALFGIVFTASLFLVPIYSGFRMAAERADTNVDLLFVTTIRPVTIVLGKVISAAMLVILLFSASLPFLVFSYVLRGIDFVSIAGLVAFSVVVVVSQSTLALFIGSLPTSKPFKLFLGVGFFVGTFFIYVPILELMSQIMRGFGMFFVPRSLPYFLGFLGMIALLDTALIVLTTVIITPAAANRALPIRAMLATVWGIALAGALWVHDRTHSFNSMQMWAVAMTFAITLVLLSATSEREMWRPRVARTIPANPLLRAIAFLFYSGAAGGTAWALWMYALTIGVFATAEIAFERGQTKWHVLLDAALAMIGYAMTAVFVRRRVLKRVPASRTWVIAIALFFVLTVLPPITMIARDSDSNTWSTWVHVTTLLNPFPMPGRMLHLQQIRTGILALWAIVMLLANATWFAEQMRRFRPVTLSREDGEGSPLRPELASARSFAVSAAQDDGAP